MSVIAQTAEYVFAERQKIAESNHIPVGTNVVIIYLGLDKRKPKSDPRAFSIEQARQMHADLSRILEEIDDESD